MMSYRKIIFLSATLLFLFNNCTRSGDLPAESDQRLTSVSQDTKVLLDSIKKDDDNISEDTTTSEKDGESIIEFIKEESENKSGIESGKEAKDIEVLDTAANIEDTFEFDTILTRVDQDSSNYSSQDSTSESAQQDEKLDAVYTIIDHKIFDELLKKYVNANGVVNYKGFKKETSKLKSYCNYLSTIQIDNQVNRDDELAFWINAYNAYTILLIVENYPLNSIMALDGGKVWERKWINLNGEKLSLNSIENEIIRPKFQEPRIHFAVNCAAKSCPPLKNSAWTASTLEQDFQSQTKKFINNTMFNQIGVDEVVVSKIFEWYASDFGDIKAYIEKYTDVKISGAKLSYNEYDWALNE